MKKETPTAQAYIDLLHIAMGQVEQRARELEQIGRITEEQNKTITDALNKLGDTVGTALRPEIKKERPVRTTMEFKAKNLYPNGLCPDCFKKIPEEDSVGNSCKICGHVWTTSVYG